MPKVIVATESGHWYDQEGKPFYTIIGANGKERNTNLRDARKLNLFPSVTTIMKIKDAPALNIWKQNQILLSAATLPLNEGESVDSWCKRVAEDSKREGIKAAEKGSAIHGQVERHVKGKKVLSHKEEVKAVQGQLDILKVTEAQSERSFSHEFGYAGKIDLPCLVDGRKAIIDIKSKDFKPKSKMNYFDQCIQGAAYSMGHYGTLERVINLYISRNLPEPEAVFYEWSEQDVSDAWEIFKRLVEIWQIEKKFHPVFIDNNN